MVCPATPLPPFATLNASNASSEEEQEAEEEEKEEEKKKEVLQEDGKDSPLVVRLGLR